VWDLRFDVSSDQFEILAVETYPQTTPLRRKQMKRLQPISYSLTAMLLLLAWAPVSMADAVAGKAVYDGKGACASCHGPSGKGDGPAAAALKPKPRDFAAGTFALDTDGDGQTGTDTDLYNVIHDGAAKYGGAATMPGRTDLSEQEIKDLVAFIRSLQS
jgi:mono/diheme cytochrome c family protein